MFLYTVVIHFFKKSEYATFQVVCGLAERECIDPPTTKLN